MSQVERDVCPLCGHAERYGMTNDEVDMTKAKGKREKTTKQKSKRQKKLCMQRHGRAHSRLPSVRSPVRTSVS